jgi:hypothetical protein
LWWRIVASALMAWIHLRSASIWYDEVITLLTTSGHANARLVAPTANLVKIVSDLYTRDVHPPLYFCTLAISRMIFGGSLEATRALSALFTHTVIQRPTMHK